jgi:RHH-type proline utilization regulon transcriptional repressor/proline dehydrogenase/delta 1-pyrroline-5-carboxylate dehydrogenase
VIAGGGIDRLRLLQLGLDFNESIRRVCIDRFVPLLAKPVIATGFVEPLWFIQEQSISHDYHRYGNLGRRAGEQRRE